MDTVLQVLSDDPVPVRQLQPRTPRDLETICLKCLQKDPARRYASAEELARDLHRFGADEPIEARPAGLVERGLKWMRRRPATAALLGLSLLTGLVLVIAGLWFTAQLARERDRAVAARHDAETEKAAAVAARQDAEEARHRTAAELRRAEVLLYAGQLNSALREWEVGHFNQAWRALDSCRWDLRGWEHRYLYTLFTSNQAALTGHAGGILAVAVSSDGRRLASASDDTTVKVWDASLGKELCTFKRHDRAVNVVAFSPDGKLLASGGLDSRLPIHDADTGQFLSMLSPGLGQIRALAFSPDSKLLAVAGDSPTVKLLDPLTGQQKQQLTGLSSPVLGLAFSPDGKRLLCTSGTMGRVWDLGTSQVAWTLAGHSAAVTAVAWSGNGLWIATASADQTVRLWSGQTGQAQLALPGHKAEVTSVAFNAHSTRLLSGSADSNVILWDPVAGRALQILRGHSQPVRGVVYSPAGRHVISGGDDQVLLVQDTFIQTLSPARANAAVPCVAFRADGLELASAAGTLVRFWDVAGRRELLALTGHPEAVLCLACAPDGKRLASGGTDKKVRLWDLAGRKELLVLNGHTGAVRSLAFGPEGQLASGGAAGAGGTVILWDQGKGRPAWSAGHEGHVNSVAFHPAGRRLASGAEDRLIKVVGFGHGRAAADADRPRGRRHGTGLQWRRHPPGQRRRRPDRARLGRRVGPTAARAPRPPGAGDGRGHSRRCRFAHPQCQQ